MVAIFTRTTTVLSTDFASLFSPDQLALTLYKVGQETGVQFYREEATFGISGQWKDIVSAHQSLEKCCDVFQEDQSPSLEDAGAVKPALKVRINFDEVRRGRKPGSTSKPKTTAFANIPEPLVIREHGNHHVLAKTVYANSESAVAEIIEKTVNVGRNTAVKSNRESGSTRSKNAASKTNKTELTEVAEDASTIDKHSAALYSDTEISQTDKSESEVNDASIEKLEPEFQDKDNFNEGNDSDGGNDDTDDRFAEALLSEQNAENTDSDKTIDVKLEPEEEKIETPTRRGLPRRATRSRKNYVPVKSVTVARKKVKKKEIVDDGPSTYECSKCSFIAYKKETLKSHMKRKHRMKKYICDMCDKKFGLNKDLKRHRLQVHSKPAFSCDECGKAYKCQQSLDKHLKAHEEDNLELSSEQSAVNESWLVECEIVQTEIGDSEYRCSQCDYVTKQLAMFRDHKKRNHMIRFTCKQCGKQFGFSKDLKRHKYRNHASAPYMCEICTKFYRSKKSFQEHVQSHNEGYVKEVFKCDLCPKEFSNKYILATHVKSSHLGIKNSYVCPTCGRSFTQKASYMVHANVHAGIKPFVCDKCGQAFAYENSYKRHRLNHENLGNRYTCDVCLKQFPHPTNLHTHMKIHRGKRDFLCTTCGKEFTQKQALQRHERIHTGDKPFVCDICQRSFTDYSIIRRHLMLMHKKEPKEWKKHVISYVKKSTGYFIETINSSGEKVSTNQQPRSEPPSAPVVPSASPVVPSSAPTEIIDKEPVQRMVKDSYQRIEKELPKTRPPVPQSYAREGNEQTTGLDLSQNMPHLSHIMPEPSVNMTHHSNNMQNIPGILPFTGSQMYQPFDGMLYAGGSMNVPHLSTMPQNMDNRQDPSLGMHPPPQTMGSMAQPTYNTPHMSINMPHIPY